MDFCVDGDVSNPRMLMLCLAESCKKVLRRGRERNYIQFPRESRQNEGHMPLPSKL